MFVSSCTCSLQACELSAEDAAIISKGLSVSASIKKVNVLSNSIGTEGGQALADAAPPQLQTFCGFEEGQTKADLSDERLVPGDVVLLAWELTTGYVSASLKSIDLSNNRLCGVWDSFSGWRKGTYDPTGIQAIAAALNVNASLTSLK